MKPLADKVLENQKDENGKVNFYPPRFEHTLNTWMEISKIGVFLVNFGGDTVFQLGITKKLGEVLC